MKDSYDPQAFFDFLGYAPATQPYYCPGQRTLAVYARGVPGQLEKLLEPTPFVLVDDVFMVTVTDFGNTTLGSFYDSGVMLRVRYGDRRGGTFIFEYEDQPWSIAAGRELWGYPKHFANVALEDDSNGASGRVWVNDELLFEIGLDYGGEPAEPTQVGGGFYPHLQVKAIPESAGAGFSIFEVLSRDTSMDFSLRSQRTGGASLTLGDRISVAGTPLEVREVLGGAFIVGDYASTPANGIPTVLASMQAAFPAVRSLS